MYEKLTPPTEGSQVTFDNGKPIVPDDPIIPFIRGDGTGVDIWPATQKVIDAAVAHAYAGKRKINWKKLQAMAVHNLAFLSKVLNLQHFYDWLNVCWIWVLLEISIKLWL